MTTYQREVFDDVLPEAMPLLEAHWEELNNAPGDSLDVNLEIYKQSDTADVLRVFTAREDDILIGYSAVFVHQGLHQRQQKQATQDVFYVLPRCRGGMVGTRLIKFAEDELKQEGVSVYFTHANVKNMLLGHLLEVLGHEPIATTYQRKLTPCHKPL